MAHKILLLGADGQIGWELARSLITLGEVCGVTRDTCDLSNRALVEKLVSSLDPTIVVNAAAYTAVDKAESEPDLACALNFELPKTLANLCLQRDTLLVDYSTDYVFDGCKESAYTESDPYAPANEYGKSKLKGLQALEGSGCRHLVFRVSWVYSSRRNNFVKTIVRLANERDSLNIIDDQFGTPCSSRWLADMTVAALHSLDRGRGSEGVYNLTPDGETTWFGFAKEIVQQASLAGASLRLSPENIQPIATEQYPTPAARPKNSRLDKSKFCKTFGFPLTEWSSLVPLVINELLSHNLVKKTEKA